MPEVSLSEIHFRAYEVEPDEEEEEVELFGLDDYVTVEGSIYLNGIIFRAWQDPEEEEEEE